MRARELRVVERESRVGVVVEAGGLRRGNGLSNVNVLNLTHTLLSPFFSQYTVH